MRARRRRRIVRADDDGNRKGAPVFADLATHDRHRRLRRAAPACDESSARCIAACAACRDRPGRVPSARRTRDRRARRASIFPPHRRTDRERVRRRDCRCENPAPRDRRCLVPRRRALSCSRRARRLRAVRPALADDRRSPLTFIASSVMRRKSARGVCQHPGVTAIERFDVLRHAECIDDAGNAATEHLVARRCWASAATRDASAKAGNGCERRRPSHPYSAARNARRRLRYSSPRRFPAHMTTAFSLLSL